MTNPPHTELAALREKFEAWMRREYPAVDLTHRVDGSYWSTAPDAFWEGFQACAAALESSERVQGEAEIDAARYRFLKKYSRGELFDKGVELDWYEPTKDLDALIDQATAKEPL